MGGRDGRERGRVATGQPDPQRQAASRWYDVPLGQLASELGERDLSPRRGLVLRAEIGAGAERDALYERTGRELDLRLHER